jgi:hypothetical protein
MCIGMDWLKNHSYLATWLSFCLAFLVALWRTKGAIKLSEINWTWLFIYVAFVVSFGVALTPTFDDAARSFARTLAGASFGGII